MTKEMILESILDSKIIAIIRMADADKVVPVCEAIAEGGIKNIEITLTTPGALDAIKELSGNTDLHIGVGSVINKKSVIESIEAGAQYIVSPITKRSLIETSHKDDIPIICGAVTPTEMNMAHECGADLIKLFPAAHFGSSYLKSVLAPLPHLSVLPTGGINAQNANEWLEAGAVSIGVGVALLDKISIENEDYAAITNSAKALFDSIQKI